MRLLEYLAFALLILISSRPAYAQTPASAPVEAVRTGGAVTDEAVLAKLMQSGRYAEARLVAERIVLINPLNAGAWLDLAIAARQLGDETTARELFDYIEKTFNPPPALRALIARLRKPLAPVVPERRWSADVTLLAGHEDNANVAPSVSSLTLALPEAPITVYLEPQYLPHPSPVTAVEARGQGELPVSGTGLRLLGFAELKDRRPTDLPDSRTRQLQAIAGLRGPMPSFASGTGLDQWTLWATIQKLDQGGIELLDSQRLQFTVDRPVHDCRGYSGLDAERRRYPVQPVLDGRVRGVVAGFSCPGLGGLWTLNLHFGVDQPVQVRAGGEQRRLDLTIGLQRPVLGRGRLEVIAAYSRAWDSEPYSVLLGDVTRTLDRDYLRVEYSHPIGAHWDWLLRGEFQRQNSNIALFDIPTSALLAGLRKTF